MAISSREYGIAVCNALGIDPNKVRRVVIDADVNDALRVYVEMWGGPELIKISLPTSDVEVAILNGKTDSRGDV